MERAELHIIPRPDGRFYVTSFHYSRDPDGEHLDGELPLVVCRDHESA